MFIGVNDFVDFDDWDFDAARDLDDWDFDDWDFDTARDFDDWDFDDWDFDTERDLDDWDFDDWEFDDWEFDDRGLDNASVFACKFFSIALMVNPIRDSLIVEENRRRRCVVRLAMIMIKFDAKPTHTPELS
tara:strand:- start:186 stop:578 length:393 start_codon:yes stop_codon:yes gene_type:complete